MRQSAPGKVILMGEHAVVYGRPALVAAIDLRLRAELEPARRPGVEIELPDLDHRTSAGWGELLDYSRRAAERWSAFVRNSEAVPFAEVRGADPAHLAKLALAEAQGYRRQAAAPDLRLRVSSQIPVGAGFGSSAALTVAVLAGYLRYCGEEVSGPELDRLALEVERRQHGTPSGVDSAAVSRGGVLWAVRRKGEELALERVVAAGPLLGRLRIFSTGTPRDSTGAVVAAVREGWRREPRRFESIFDRIEAATRMMRHQLEGGADGGVVAAIRESAACLEALGVVPPAIVDVVRRVEEAGGAAKISGAGALGGSAAGSLLVYHPAPESLSSRDRMVPFPEHAVCLGAEGVRWEDPPPRSPPA